MKNLCSIRDNSCLKIHDESRFPWRKSEFFASGGASPQRKSKLFASECRFPHRKSKFFAPKCRFPHRKSKFFAPKCRFPHRKSRFFASGRGFPQRKSMFFASGRAFPPRRSSPFSPSSSSFTSFFLVSYTLYIYTRARGLLRQVEPDAFHRCAEKFISARHQPNRRGGGSALPRDGRIIKCPSRAEICIIPTKIT